MHGTQNDSAIRGGNVMTKVIAQIVSHERIIIANLPKVSNDELKGYTKAHLSDNHDCVRGTCDFLVRLRRLQIVETTSKLTTEPHYTLRARLLTKRAENVTDAFANYDCNPVSSLTRRRVGIDNE